MHFPNFCRGCQLQPLSQWMIAFSCGLTCVWKRFLSVRIDGFAMSEVLDISISTVAINAHTNIKVIPRYKLWHCLGTRAVKYLYLYRRNLKGNCMWYRISIHFYIPFTAWIPSFYYSLTSSEKIHVKSEQKMIISIFMNGVLEQSKTFFFT